MRNSEQMGLECFRLNVIFLHRDWSTMKTAKSTRATLCLFSQRCIHTELCNMTRYLFVLIFKCFKISPLPHNACCTEMSAKIQLLMGLWLATLHNIQGKMFPLIKKADGSGSDCKQSSLFIIYTIAVIVCHVFHLSCWICLEIVQIYLHTVPSNF